jgi:hypothetical protein
MKIADESRGKFDHEASGLGDFLPEPQKSEFFELLRKGRIVSLIIEVPDEQPAKSDEPPIGVAPSYEAPHGLGLEFDGSVVTPQRPVATPGKSSVGFGSYQADDLAKLAIMQTGDDRAVWRKS